jgi:CRP-like cAMP-binding protein
VFNEGDIGDYMGIILSGKLDVKKQTEFKGRQVIIASLKEGSFVGEMSLVNEHEPRSATVSASEDSQIVILKREALESLIQKYPYIGVKILKGLNQVLAIRLRKTVERMTSMF